MSSGIVRGFYRGLDDIFSRSDISDMKTAEAASNYTEIWLKTARANDYLELELAACNALGGVCCFDGRIKRAKELCGRALEIIDDLGLAGTEEHAVALINAGAVYIAEGECGKALNIFMQAESVIEAQRAKNAQEMNDDERASQHSGSGNIIDDNDILIMCRAGNARLINLC